MYLQNLNFKTSDIFGQYCKRIFYNDKVTFEVCFGKHFPHLIVQIDNAHGYNEFHV
jgi:hypothetical protein